MANNLSGKTIATTEGVAGTMSRSLVYATKSGSKPLICEKRPLALTEAALSSIICGENGSSIDSENSSLEADSSFEDISSHEHLLTLTPMVPIPINMPTKEMTIGSEKNDRSTGMTRKRLFNTQTDLALNNSTPTNSPNSTKVISISKQRKIQERNELQRRLEESQIALEEDSLDLPENPITYEELLKSKVTLENKISLMELSFAQERKQLNDQIALKDKLIGEKNAEIFYISTDNPLLLTQSLNEGLQALLELTKSGSSLIPVAPRTPATAGETQIKLDESCETVISRNVLKNAISYGKSGPSTVYLNKMVSILMKGIWDREFMASHSVSGRKCPTDKSGLPPKPALPNDPVQAIKHFCSKFWKERHNTNITHAAISHSISAKLLREHSAVIKP